MADSGIQSPTTTTTESLGESKSQTSSKVAKEPTTSHPPTVVSSPGGRGGCVSAWFKEHWKLFGIVITLAVILIVTISVVAHLLTRCNSTPDENEKIVDDMLKQVYIHHDFSNLEKYFGKEGYNEFVIHSNIMGNGTGKLQDFRNYLKARFPAGTKTPKGELPKYVNKTSTEDLVIFFYKNGTGNDEQAIIDMFRIQCRKIAEYWSVVQNISGTIDSIKETLNNTNYTHPHPFFRNKNDREKVDPCKGHEIGKGWHKEQVNKLYQNMFTDLNFANIDKLWVQDDLIQHDPWIQDGFQAFNDSLPSMMKLFQIEMDNKTKKATTPFEFANIVEDKDNGRMIWTLFVTKNKTMIAEIFRIDCIKIVEHFIVVEHEVKMKNGTQPNANTTNSTK